MKFRLLCAVLLLCVLAFGQQPDRSAAFEVASIKPAQPMPMGRMMIGMNADAGMLRYTNVSLKDCIRAAYRVEEFQIQGPDWLGSQRFDIVAKLPDGSSKEQIPEMLQNLLAERFKLTLHKETKHRDIYALVVGKNGPKLKPAEVSTAGPAPAEPPPAGAKVRPGNMPRNAMFIQMGPEGAHLKAPSATLTNLAGMLSRFTERPVIDMTGIQGEYDFDLVFSPETMRHVRVGAGPMPPPGAGGPPGAAAGEHSPMETAAEPAGSIYDSVQRYGLKLDPRKAPMEILVVDHIESTPTEN